MILFPPQDHLRTGMASTLFSDLSTRQIDLQNYNFLIANSQHQRKSIENCILYPNPIFFFYSLISRAKLIRFLISDWSFPEMSWYLAIMRTFLQTPAVQYDCNKYTYAYCLVHVQCHNLTLCKCTCLFFALLYVQFVKIRVISIIKRSILMYSRC